MIKIGLEKQGLEGHYFVDYFCPGCKTSHGLPVTIGLEPEKKIPSRWQFNGDVNHPTISPSVNCEPNNPEYQCHHFVKDGKIEFLKDCFHALAGQTVELAEYE